MPTVNAPIVVPNAPPRRSGLLRAALLACVAGAATAFSPAALAQNLVSNSITYQGELADGGAPANGQYDIRFRAFNSVGGPIGPIITAEDVNVQSGRFTINLDFGDIYNGEARFLELSVRPGASAGAFTTLSPRQELTATPYAQGLQLPLTQTVSTSSTLLTLTNQNIANTATVLRLISAAPSGNPSGLSFQPVLVTDTNDGNGIATYVSSSAAIALYASTEGSNGVGVFATQGAAAGRVARFQTTETTNPTNAVEISHAGVGRGLSIQVFNSLATSNALEVSQSGTGRAGLFTNANADSTAPTLAATNNGTGESIPTGTQENGIAIKGTSTGAFGIGVLGRGVTAGVFGFSGTTGGSGVYGVTAGGGGSNSAGVRGDGNGAGTTGVAGFNNLGTAVFGQTTTGAGIFGSNGGSNTTGFAGDFNGRVRVQGNLQVTGTVSKGAGSFKIDHPLDPENKFLYHSFVESPDMKNIYDGVVTLDADGHATVTLPHYFGALNKDYRYQLTCIGGYAPVYIAREVANNSFEIAGGKPGLKVSWTVTGIRQDPYANTHRIETEVEKSSDEKGLYLYPEAYGQPETRRIGGAPQSTFVQPETAPN